MAITNKIRSVELRYVVLDTREDGDQFETVLSADATEEDGIAELDRQWSYLTPAEQKKATMELVRMACLIEDGDISTAVDEAEDRGYIESRGWDWWGSYTPITTRTEEDFND